MRLKSNDITIPDEPHRIAPMLDSTDLLNQPAALKERFGQDGYLYLRGVLPRERVMKLRGTYFGMFDPSYLRPRNGG